MTQAAASSITEFILSRVVTPLPDCMIWPSATDSGYGRIEVNGKSRRVHRLMWEAEHGPIPEGLTIDHLCRVRACCNTAHMELVTSAENTRRAKAHAISRWSLVTSCKRGHEFTPENTRVRPSGQRACRACERLAKQASRRRAAEIRAGADA